MEDNLQILMPVTFTEGCDSYVSLIFESDDKPFLFQILS